MLKRAIAFKAHTHTTMYCYAETENSLCRKKETQSWSIERTDGFLFSL